MGKRLVKLGKASLLAVGAGVAAAVIAKNKSNGQKR